MLLGSSIVDARADGDAVDFEALPESVLSRVEALLAEADPLAELMIDNGCPACGYRWHSLFDIVSFFWIEISASARRLLGDVHLLARAYGWREADILAMSPLRRSYYLEMVR
jgi:hypothetical protein